MSDRPVYLDSSALLLLILSERESEPLLEALEQWPDRVSSVVAGVECRRALRRVNVPRSVHRRADAVLAAMTLIRVDEPVLRHAETLDPAELGVLGALHLATALSIGDDPEALITYDDRLASAAREAGLVVLQPGR
ncbi:MAG TPA: PIN domain-containing protein [Vicinamibacterales bacterium]|nr:PIN domain-containing protein [Vicinamibacterales bacterium]